MKTPSILAIALTMIGLSINVAFAQAEGVGETASLQAKFEERVKLDVLRPHGLAVADLNAKFMSALARAQEAAQNTGKLEDAVAIKTEKEAVLAGNYTPAEDGAGTPAGVKTLRNTYRTALAKLELDRDKKLQPLKAAFSKGLEGVIDSLTKNGKLDEAIAAKKLRAELVASSGGGTSVTIGKETFVNSLGMKFVPLSGTSLLICIHETRNQDYAAFMAENPGGNAGWKSPTTKEGVPVSDSDDHPAVMVNWTDAQAFCTWISMKENKEYRLPTDREWSQAVGIDRDENETEIPENLNAKVRDEYPWGSRWPPPKDSGNFADLSTKLRLPEYQVISEHNDGFPTTAPVMKFKPNKLGIYDLSGNVWEWTQDWFNKENRERVLRGGSWFYYEGGGLLSSYRSRRSPVDRNLYCGFRCVIVSKP